MRKRSRARELALQVLYRMDITREDAGQCLDSFWLQQQEEKLDQAQMEFTTELVLGVWRNLARIDEKISAFASNWKLERMAVLDRNILRIGCFELLLKDDIPPKVSINEAVDLAKKYSGQEAGKFVNAILDKIKTERKK